MTLTRVLITGNKGFIGTHLTRELAEHGYDVRGHDRDDGDLLAPGMIAKRLDNTKPDQVVHLAAHVGRLFGEDNFAVTIAENATMTTILAKACGERDIPVLFSSTSEVYGDRGNGVAFEEPVTPWDHGRLPHNLYGLSKRWGEEALRLYAPEGLRIVRLSMPYGPGAPPGRGRRALDTFLWQAHHRMPITVHRGAERSWCHVRDTVAGIRTVLEQADETVYNIGRDDAPLPMLALALKACELTGAPRSLIEVVDPPAMQTVVKRLSTTRLRRLGWKPTIELDEGLHEVLEWVKRFDANGDLIEERKAA